MDEKMKDFINDPETQLKKKELEWCYRTDNWKDIDRSKMHSLRAKGKAASYASSKHDPEMNPCHQLQSNYVSS